MVYLPPKIYPNSQNEDIPGTAVKKEDQLEIVGSNEKFLFQKIQFF